MDFLTFFIVTATAIGIVRALPQLARLLRTSDAHGVSPDTAATTSIVSIAWVLYGVLTAQPAVAIASGASAVMFAAVTMIALRLGRSIRELRAAPIWLVALSLAVAIGGVRGLGVLLPVSVLVANTPQLIVAWKESDVSGLSLGTWLLSTLEAMLWGVYGYFSGDITIRVHSTLYLLSSGAIVTLRVMKRRV